VSAAQESLRLVGEAIVEAAALDGDRTAVDATVRPDLDRSRAWLDLTIGGWFATATGTGLTPDVAVVDCLRNLDGILARRNPARAEATTRRAREALAAALTEVAS